ncbi:MAG TPA: hypothetical protein VD905_13865 [Flavobacteriales bacterium]|nr:hypothetical protein [Flavobacteriales bacterium]
MKITFLSLLALLMVKWTHAGTAPATDSAKAVKSLTEFLGLCKKISREKPEKNSGYFKKAAAFVIYRGSDTKRKWKDFTNPKNKREMSEVESICYRVHTSVCKDPGYKITRYKTEEESEGVWHLVYVDYTSDGVIKTAVFAFLKVNNRFGIGDID